MNFNVIKRDMFIGAIGLVGMAAPVHANDTTTNPFENSKWERMPAHRRIAGTLSHNRLVREKHGKDYMTVLEYYVDTNGDKNPDYVLKQIIPDGTPVPGYESGAALEFSETAHENGGFYVDEVRKLACYVMTRGKFR